MSRGPSTFKQRDLTAACKAAKAAGLEIASVEIAKDGTIRIVSSKLSEAAPESDRGEWTGATL